MDRLRLRGFVLGVCLIAAGAAIQAMPRPQLHAKDETFMIAKAPTQIGAFKFVQGQTKPGCSYDVDERTYELLQPFGVVGRVYTDGVKGYDVMLISGNDKNCFHDNRVCFSGQGFSITKQSDESVETPRGTIPITLLELEHKERGRMMAAMFFKGPHGKWYALPANLTFAMFLEQVKLGSDLNSTFYRIIPTHANPSKEDLKQFIRDYVVAAEKSSEGFF